MKILCDVVVLCWNKLEVTKQFIKSFYETVKLPVRLIIIDNGSQDGTDQYLLTLEETENIKLEIVINKENKGFVRGMNQGISLSEAPFVCLANNDLIFTEGWLEEMMSLFEKDSRIGLLNPNSSNMGNYPKESQSVKDYAAEVYQQNKGVFYEMPFCIGYCMLIRREVIEKVGGMSEEFIPMFFEDTDYSMKVAHAGYKIGLSLGSYVYHAEHSSMSQLKDEKREQIFQKSKREYEKKWGSILRILFVVKNEQELESKLQEACDIATKGNHVWIMVPKIDFDRKDLFQKCGLYEHTGVNFIESGGFLKTLWLILKKKKPYRYILTSDERIKRVMKFFGKPVSESFDRSKYELLKFSQKKGASE